MTFRPVSYCGSWASPSRPTTTGGPAGSPRAAASSTTPRCSSRSSRCAPPTSSPRGRSLGALTLVQAESGRRFDKTDIAFVQQLASSAALALDNARLYEQRRSVADILQTALLPTSLPEAPGLRLAARYQPCSLDDAGITVGGDFYDVIATGQPGRWA